MARPHARQRRGAHRPRSHALPPRREGIRIRSLPPYLLRGGAFVKRAMRQCRTREVPTAPCHRLRGRATVRQPARNSNVEPATLGRRMMSSMDTAGSAAWYRTLNRTQWKALIASNLGWTFDGFEVFSLILTIGAALHQLLDPSQYKLIPAYAGTVIAITVFGWGLGGLCGGILADYIGRKRSMTLTILAYSLLTGLSALSWNWWSFAALRFLVGLAIGSEWATGASITAELWPNHARGKGGAFLQCGYPIGSIIASAVWVLIGTSGPGAWRYMFLIGVLPALIAFW